MESPEQDVPARSALRQLRAPRTKADHMLAISLNVIFACSARLPGLPLSSAQAEPCTGHAEGPGALPRATSAETRRRSAVAVQEGNPRVPHVAARDTQGTLVSPGRGDAGSPGSTAAREESSQREERPGQKRTLWQGKTLVMKAGRKEGSGRAGRPRVPPPRPSTPAQPRASSPGSNRTITAQPAATPRRGKLKCPFDPRRAGAGKQEAGAMIRKGFFGAAPGSCSSVLAAGALWPPSFPPAPRPS